MFERNDVQGVGWGYDGHFQLSSVARGGRGADCPLGRKIEVKSGRRKNEKKNKRREKEGERKGKREEERGRREKKRKKEKRNRKIK